MQKVHRIQEIFSVMDNVRLSKKMSYVLRHAPWVYELELDDEGWVPLEQLLSGLRDERAFSTVQVADLHRLMANSAKTRFEIDGDRIRAIYGHSIPGKLKRTVATPPEILYHGTVERALPAIREHGLKPMRRQYVHLSVDTDMANTVASRRSDSPVVLLTIQAAEAARHGVIFYLGNEHVWLADAVPSEWINVPGR